MKNRTATMTALSLSILAGLGAGVAGMASAQTTGVAATSSTPGTVVTDTSTVTPAVTPSTTATATSATTGTTPTRPKGHTPGQDGNITAINGTTITMQEESHEGGTVYTVDASGATFTKDGVSATLSSLAVGNKISVDGTVSGTNVTATRVSLGHPGGHGGPKGHTPGQDGNITAINGTTITMQEESHEGGTVYTVDASGATFTKDGVSATLSSLAVGNKISVDGTVSGTNVTATRVSLGHPRGHTGGRGKREGQ